MLADVEVRHQLAPKLQFLDEPHRYKVVHGGRGGAKSYGIADYLLVAGAEQPLRILCTREFQNSIEDSVHRLLKDRVTALGLDSFYEVQKTVIKGVNGTTFGFEGLKRNIQSLKSWEGADKCWVEEADVVSDDSWEILIPTIRKDGSEIIISFNPKLDDDPTYKRFVLNPPKTAKVVEINWRDNPWFNDVLRAEMLELKERDYDAWLNVWEGKCRRSLVGAVYAAELRKAEEENRIGEVPYYEGKPVDTFWDLGYRDSTAVWLLQQVGAQTRVIDYMEGSQKKLADYVRELQARGYVYGTDYVPHDAAAKELGVGLSLVEQLSALGRLPQVVPRVPQVAVGIEALRQVFGQLWFDRKKCAVGINHLRRYRYVTNSSNVTGREPLHDASSHAADALRQYGQMSQTIAGSGTWAKVPTLKRRVI